MRALSVPQRTNQVLLAIVLDVGLTLFSLYLASEVRLALPFGKERNEPSVQINQFVYLLTSGIWVLVFSQFSLYTRHWVRFRDEWGVLVIAVLSGLLILAGCLYLSFRQVSRLQFLY